MVEVMEKMQKMEPNGDGKCAVATRSIDIIGQPESMQCFT